MIGNFVCGNCASNCIGVCTGNCISGLASPQGRQKPSRRCSLPTSNKSLNITQLPEIDQTKIKKNFARPYSIKNDQIWENQGFHVHEKHACMHAGITKLADYELHA